MRHKRIGKTLLSLIRFGVGVGCGLYQGNAQPASLHGVSVLAVVEKRHAVAVLGYVHPLVRIGLKFCLIPTGILMRGAGNVTVLHVKGCAHCVHVQRENRLEHLVMLVPVHIGLKVDTTAFGIQPQGLPDRGVHIVPLNHKSRSRSVGHGSNACRSVQLVCLALIVILQLPCVVSAGVVLKGNQQIALARKHLSLHPLVVKAGDLPGFVERKNIISVLGSQTVYLYLSVRLCRLYHRPAERGHGLLGFGVVPLCRNDGSPCKARGIVHENTAVGADSPRHGVHLFVYHTFPIRLYLCVIPVGSVVDLFYGRTGKDIVELIMERLSPAPVQPLGVVTVDHAQGLYG